MLQELSHWYNSKFTEDIDQTDYIQHAATNTSHIGTQGPMETSW
jgi:hypothetical protein